MSDTVRIEDEATPRQMLKEYRESASPKVLDEAALFRALPLADRCELLFYMVTNTVALLSMVLDETRAGKEPPPVGG